MVGLLLVDVGEPYGTLLSDLARRHGFTTLQLDAKKLTDLRDTFSLCVIEVGKSEHDVVEDVGRLNELAPLAPVVILAENIEADGIVCVARMPAVDVIRVPSSADDVCARVFELFATLANEPMSYLVGHSPAMRQLRRAIAAVAPARSTVLITGETGTGKGVVARALDDALRWSDRPFVHFDCCALSPGLVESELFGHEKGSFTGASTRRSGRFEIAKDGAIFLDEIGELDIALQAKLLRVLADRAYERIGGTQTLSMRARIITATNRDLRVEVDEGRFRADLYFRLSVVHLHVPPLRSRLEDLPLLARAGAEKIARHLGRPTPTITPEFLECAKRYSWPGNVRELLNAIECIMVLGCGRMLDADHLEAIWANQAFFLGSKIPSRARAAAGRVAEAIALAQHDERSRITDEIERAGGNVARAARRLQMPRTTLLYRIRKYGLNHMIPRD